MAKKASVTVTEETKAADLPGPKLNMQRTRYEFVLEAELPIAHASETLGNLSLIARKEVRFDGGWAAVPVVSGDTGRHGLREATAYAFLDAAGLLEQGSLSEAALRLLFAGGMVTGGGSSAVSLDQYRELVELVPMLGLLGGCAQNRVISGRCNVEDAILICEESRRYIPQWAIDRAIAYAGPLDTCRAHVEEVTRVRMDPMLVPEKRMLLTSCEQARVNERLLASESAATSGDLIERENTKSSMMPRQHERIKQGSLFYWAAEARTYSPLEADTFDTACAGFLANAIVGGKRSTGHGRLRAIAGKKGELARPKDALADIDPTALAPKMGEIFKSHVAERRDRIKSFLASVAA